jgi:hypothetical protein
VFFIKHALGPFRIGDEEHDILIRRAAVEICYRLSGPSFPSGQTLGPVREEHEQSIFLIQLLGITRLYLARYSTTFATWNLIDHHLYIIVRLFVCLCTATRNEFSLIIVID